MPDDLLGLFLTELELCRRQETAQGNLAELLLLEELCDVHPHAQLLMPLLDLAEEAHRFAC